MKQLSLLAMQMLYHKFDFFSPKYAGKRGTSDIQALRVSGIVLGYFISTSSSNTELFVPGCQPLV